MLTLAQVLRQGPLRRTLATRRAQARTNRDFDYASNGDLYARVNNYVVRANRTDASDYSTTPTTLFTPSTAANNVGENIAVVEGYSGNSLFAIYNDHGSNATGQAFTSVVDAVNASGASVALSFLTADGTAASSIAASTGTAYYDFSYDPTSQTLALLDESNNQLYIFGATPTPEPVSISALTSAGLLLLRRRRA